MTNNDQEFLKEVNEKHFRVAVFGSARTKKDEGIYQKVFDLAYKLGERNIDIVTGGGPGIMEAANAGHQAGDPGESSDSIGLTIRLPWEADANPHLDLKKHFNRFSGRLDTFMTLSNVVVVMPGGIGTCLELFYTWQLIQVKHINKIPIILIGEMWEKLMKWVAENPLKDGLISPEDTEFVYIVKSNKEAIEIIEEEKSAFEKGEACGNNKKYKFQA